MTIKCRDGAVMDIHITPAGDGFYFTKERDKVRTICEISANSDIATVYDRDGNVLAEGVPEVMRKYKLSHYKNCHSIEIVTGRGALLYCVLKDGEYHIGLTDDEYYNELMVIDEIGVNAIIPHG